MFVTVLFPIYGALSKLEGTHTYLYAWTVSAAFKHSVAAAGVLLVVWLSVLLFSFVFLTLQYSNNVKKQQETAKDSTHLLFVQSRLFARLIFIFVINFFMILVPNIG